MSNDSSKVDPTEGKPRKHRSVKADQQKADNKELWEKPPAAKKVVDQSSMVDLLGVLLSEDGAFAAMCEDTFSWHNDRMDNIKQPRVSPTSVYEVMRYDSDLFSKPSGTRIIMTDIARLMEDAMLLCLAFERAQNDVLIPEEVGHFVNAFSDLLIPRNPEGMSGFRAVANHAQVILRGICDTHYCNAKAVDSGIKHPDGADYDCSLGIHGHLVALSSAALTALGTRVGLLFRAGVCSPIHAANTLDLLASIVGDILTLNGDSGPVTTVDVFESNRMLGLVAAALRIHNTTVASTVFDMTTGSCTTIVKDYPVLTTNWMIKNEKQS